MVNEAYLNRINAELLGALWSEVDTGSRKSARKTNRSLDQAAGAISER
jgi:hypothetical protein